MLFARLLHLPPLHVERREVLVCKNSRCRADAITAERSPTPMIVRRAGVSLYEGSTFAVCDERGAREEPCAFLYRASERPW